jgi:iron complex outermembrane receptor protein
VAETYLNYAAPLNVVPGNIDLTAGYSYTQSTASYPGFAESGLTSNLLGVYGVPSATNYYLSNFVSEYKLISFFGRVNYNLNDRFLLAASLRRDGSSRFGPGNQWGNFPSLSLAWRISRERFLSGVHALSELKLRAGWARTGNQAFGDYLQYPTYSYSNSLAMYPIAGQYYSTIRPSAVDPDIHWETTNAYNLGVDFGLFNQRVTGSFDWYTKNTKDLLFNVPVASGTNFSNYVTTNIGTMRNRGVELNVSAKVLEERRSGLGWTADFTVGHNANTLLSINPSRSVTLINVGYVGFGSVQVLMPGQPVNLFYVWQQVYDTVRTSPTFGRPLEGQYVDQNGDGVINQDDLRPHHSPWPSLELGHTSTFTYRNFDLSFTLRAETGNFVYNAEAAGAHYAGLMDGGSPGNLNAAVLKTNFVQPQFLSDLFVEDASFLRMDNITVGYSFRVSARRWRVYATVQNAFTITGYSGVDPTAGLLGLDASIYPRSRTFSAGLSAQF